MKTAIHIHNNIVSRIPIYLLTIGFFILSISLFAQGPGGVSGNLLSWWKADAGITGSSPVTAWNDQSGNALHLSATTGPTLVNGDINFHPSLSFNGTSQFMQVTNGVFGTSTYNDLFVYIVNKTNAVQNSSIFRETLSGGDRFGTHLPWGDANVYYDVGTCCGSSRISTNWGTVTDRYHFWTLASSTGTSTPSGTRKAIYRDGLQIVSNDQNDGGTGSNNTFYLGSSNSSSSFHSGNIAEFIIYNGVPSAAELIRIHSYLGIKYGITMDQSTATAYTSSSGATIYASGSGGTHDDYDNSITGIGRDDNSGLDQRQSISLNADARVIMDKGGAFGADEDFVVWGNDNGSLSATSTGTHPSSTFRLTRVWRADVTGTPGAVTVRFILGAGVVNSGDPADYALLMDNSDTDFSSGATAHTAGASINGDTLTFTGVTFSDGDFFTLGTEFRQPGPGGFSNGILGWWRANTGVTGSSPVTQWDDQSGNSHHFTTTAGPGLLSADANFNPGLSFDGSTQFMQVVNGLFGTSTYDDVFVFMMNRSNVVQSQTVFFETLSGGDRFGAHLPWSDANIYYDVGTCCGSSRINANWGGTTGEYHVWTLGSSTGTSTPSGTRKSVYRDGNTVVTNNNTDNATGAGNSFFIGSSNGSGSFHEGDIAEMVIYTSVPSTTELEQVHSYFSIKYGVTFPHSLRNSSGTVIWDHVANATYNNDVAGIGRDDDSQLEQKQSISQTSGAVLTMALGSVAADNASNANSFAADQSFLIWGNDGTAINSTGITDLPAGITSRVARTWFIEESGTVGTVRVQFDASNIPGNSGLGSNDLADVRLLVDDDGTFASGATQILPTSFDNSSDLVQFDIDFNGTTGFFVSLGSVSTNAPLPIELTHFRAEALSEDAVELRWTTATEINNDFFSVERSVNGIDWEVIDIVKGAGNSSSPLSYGWTDRRPYRGQSQYRLKQTDFDGTFSYSQIETVSIRSAVASLRVYPNPARNAITVEGDRSELASVDLFSLLGNSITHLVKMRRLSEEAIRIQLDALAPGSYLLRTRSGAYRIVKE